MYNPLKKFKFPIIRWFSQKYVMVSEVKRKFKLKATFSDSINFLVKYPTSDKQTIIKEYTEKIWEQEVELVNSENVYFKIFLTSNNFLTNTKGVLEIFQIENAEVIETRQKTFKLGKDLNNNEWLKISWV